MEYDKSFIKEEVIAGWTVTEKMKKVWWVQLDLIKVFASICQKHNLRWYPIGGALIGVIRHKGFIPWDDDIDLFMPREDYDKFLEICPKELEEPYFLQTTFNDEDCYMFWSSLRNSNTTGNRASCMNKRLNNGIAIDILPLDGCESNFTLYRIRRFPLRVASVICNTYVNEFNTSKKAIILRKILRMFPIDYKKIYRWIEKQNSKHPMSKYEKCTQTLVADPTFSGKKGLKRIIFDKKDFESTIELPFENITLQVPVGYDNILRTSYHDYMSFPPVEERVGKHKMVFEPDIPYKEYCSKHYGVVYDVPYKEQQDIVEKRGE